MNGLRLSRPAWDLSKRLANLNLISGQKLTPKALTDNDLNEKPKRYVTYFNVFDIYSIIFVRMRGI